MTDNSVYRLFVYGSLRKGFRSPAYEYISRFFSFVGEAKVRGRLYDMGDYPAAVPVADDTFIIGEMYDIKNPAEFSWAIGQLDDYEGVIGEQDESPLYRRELAEIYIQDKTITAWMYWYNGDITGRPVISSGDVLQYIQEKK